MKSSNIKYKALATWQTLVLMVAIITTALIGKYYINIFFHEQAKSQLYNFLDYAKQSITRIELPANKLCEEFKVGPNNRITLISLSGNVLCDTEKDHRTMENHKDRPEIRDAFNSGKGSSVRQSSTLDIPMFYGAVKINYLNKVYVLRKAIPFSFLSKTINTIYKSVFLLLIPVFVILSLLSLWSIVLYENKQTSAIRKIKEDLVSNISHEMRTPLTSIKGFIQMAMLSKDKVSSELASHLIRIEKNVDRLSVLFTDILSLSSLEKDREILRQTIDLEEFIDSTISDIKAKYPNQDIKVNTTLNISFVESDPILLQHVLGNLIDNAFKYSKEGDIISISSKTTGLNNVIEIKDTGIGIGPKDLEHIFERFYRVDHSRSRELGGTGLGLSIVKHAVDQLGGKIQVVSIENHGSTFTVTL